MEKDALYSMTMMILIRHADTGYRNTFAGRTDVPLVPGAYEKAREFAQRSLRGEGISALYSSDMKRSAATADAVGEALGLNVSDRYHELREMDFGVDTVYTADEVFVTGTFGGLTPVVTVDGHSIGAAEPPGAMTARLSDLYRAALDAAEETS